MAVRFLHLPSKPVARESLEPIKLLGCSIGIGGVFLYSLADQFWPEKKEETEAEA